MRAVYSAFGKCNGGYYLGDVKKVEVCREDGGNDRDLPERCRQWTSMESAGFTSSKEVWREKLSH